MVYFKRGCTVQSILANYANPDKAITYSYDNSLLHKYTGPWPVTCSQCVYRWPFCEFKSWYIVYICCWFDTYKLPWYLNRVVTKTRVYATLKDAMLDLLWEYRIQHGANGPLYVTSSYSTWIFCRGVSGFATDCPCGVWCRGLTTRLLHIGPPFGNRILYNSWAVGLT